MQDTGVIYKMPIAPQSPSYCICTLMTNSFIVVPHISHTAKLFQVHGVWRLVYVEQVCK